MELKTRTKTVIEVDVFELEKFLKHYFKRRVEVIATLELSNDEISSEIVPDGPMEDWENDLVNAFLADGEEEQETIVALMHHLVCEGLLQPGEYILNLSY